MKGEDERNREWGKYKLTVVAAALNSIGLDFVSIEANSEEGQTARLEYA